MYPRRPTDHVRTRLETLPCLGWRGVGLWLVGFLALWLTSTGCQQQQETSSGNQDLTYTGTGQDIQVTSWESEFPADIILVIDQSRSMSKGKNPTDPTGLRVKGSGQTLRRYAYLRHIPELNEQQPVPLGETAESVGLELAYDAELLGEIEKAVDAAVAALPEAQKAEYAGKLRQHLDASKEKLQEEAAGADPTTLPTYQRERDRVLEFIRKHHLSMGEERRG
jgi:hypothetical protein